LLGYMRHQQGPAEKNTKNQVAMLAKCGFCHHPNSEMIALEGYLPKGPFGQSNDNINKESMSPRSWTKAQTELWVYFT